MIAAVVLAAGLAVSPATVTELQAMNDADCVASKAGDWSAFEKTLAPEYVSVNVDGSRDDRASIVAYLSKPSDDSVTACSTTVSRVERDGDIYYVYGTYTEDGTRGAKRIPYHSVQRIRDAWKRAGDTWLQTESITYEMTLTQGAKTGHFVLPSPTPMAAARTDTNARVLEAAPVAYPESAKDLGLGEVFADAGVNVDAAARVTAVKIVKTAGDRFEEAPQPITVAEPVEVAP